MRQCNREGCSSPVRTKKMCNKHYRLHRHSQVPNITTSYVPIKNVVCEECGGPVQAKTLCAKHYKAKWRRENPELAKQENRRNHLREQERKRQRREAGLIQPKRRPTMNLKKELEYEKLDMWEFVKKEMGIG